jgi:hypothetical protein
MLSHGQREGVVQEALMIQYIAITTTRINESQSRERNKDMAPPQTVLTLVDKFQRNLDVYKSVQYNEAQVRNDFIEPLFCALGWDMGNDAGYAEAYRDVIFEDSLKIGTSTRAPDYSFRIGGQRKFFLEAKRPSINIKTDEVAA